MKSGPTKTTIAGVTQAPRSFADFLLGKSTAKYNRTAQPKPAAFKPKPTSNGKGVGM